MWFHNELPSGRLARRADQAGRVAADRTAGVAAAPPAAVTAARRGTRILLEQLLAKLRIQRLRAAERRVGRQAVAFRHLAQERVLARQEVRHRPGAEPGRLDAGIAG